MADSVRDLIAEFESPDREANRATADRLEALAREGLGAAEGEALLRAAADDWERPADRFLEPRDKLVWVVADNPHRELVPVVREVYARLPTKHARVGALRLLAEIATRDAEEAILELALAHRGEETHPGLWFAWGAGGEPAHPDVFFPRVLALLDDPDERWGVLSLLAKAEAAGTLAHEELADYAKPLVSATNELRKRLRRRQRPEPGPWCWKEKYAADAADLAALIDLLGHCGGPEAVAELRAVLAFTDPVLKAGAAASLVRLGEPVDAAEIEAAAERDESRSTIALALEEAGRLGELPEHLRSQAAFARAEMTDWLAFPTELERPPDELEQEAVVDTDAGAIYLFRFRDGKSWHAGVAGPYPTDGPPAIRGGGMTFSDLEPWASRPPEEHVQAILGSLPDPPE